MRRVDADCQYGHFRLLQTSANRQPAFVLYAQNKTDGTWSVHSIHVLTLADGAISTLTLFVKPMSPRLVQAFGLPAALTE
jgi:RNA polymerase sigma-70 factor, ECF subfamily